MAENTKQQTDNGGPASVPFKSPALTIDWDYYGEFLKAYDFSDEEKRELILALWNIAVSFVDLGFGIHPVQLVDEGAACGQIGDTAPDIARWMVKSIQSSEFNHAADLVKRNPVEEERRST